MDINKLNLEELTELMVKMEDIQKKIKAEKRKQKKIEQEEKRKNRKRNGMEFVYPFRPDRNGNEVVRVFNELKNDRDRLLFLFGINTALRSVDYLNLRVADVRGRDFLYIIEEKTKKPKGFPINVQLKEAFDKYIPKDAKDSDYLFQSRQRDKDGNRKSINRQMAHKIIVDAAESAGLVKRDKNGKIIEGHYGTHSLRKTWAYNAYINGVQLETISHSLNHSDIKTTKVYIALDQVSVNDAYMNNGISL